jgi:delta endotoxin, N-terminal domain
VLIPFITLSHADAQCKEFSLKDVIPWDHLINSAKTLLAFPGGLGPKQALGIASMLQVFDILDPTANNTPDPLDLFIERYEKELEENTESIVQGFFKGEIYNTREIEASYKEIYDLWVTEGKPKEEPKYNSLHNFFSFTFRQHIESGINKIIGNTNYNYYGVPMLSVMSTAYLGILRDAIYLGNDYFGIPSAGLTNYRKTFQAKLNQYTNFLNTVHNTRLQQLDTLDKKLTYESTNILEAFDIAAQWTMFIPTSYRNIPVDVMFTRPVYSRVTKCEGKGNLCTIDMNIFNKNKGNADYHGFPNTFSFINTKYTAGSAYIGFEFNYPDGNVYRTNGYNKDTSKQSISLITNINILYEKATENGFSTDIEDACAYPGPLYAKYCSRNEPNKKVFLCSPGITLCGRYPTQFIFNGNGIGITPYPGCYEKDNTHIQVPLNHAISRIIPAQYRGSHNFRWVFEYRHINNPIFKDLTADRAIRFPGEYIYYYKTSIGDQYTKPYLLKDQNYLLGGRIIRITNPQEYIGFKMPQATTHVRLYAKGPVGINGCNVNKQTFTFDGYDIYEGKCSSLEVTLINKSVISQYPPYEGRVDVFIGALEAIHLHDDKPLVGNITDLITP